MLYSFTIHEAVLKKVECRVDVGSMRGRCRVDVGSIRGQCEVDVGSMEVDVFVYGKIYRINEEVEVEEGNKKH